jgi:hypothetical protein
MPLNDINKRPRGFFTIAQDSGDNQYIRMAYALALSLKASQKEVPYLSIGITPGTKVPERYAWAFDNIIEVPWGDHAADSSWKLENEWKSIYMSPYEETIKLDADMLFFNDITSWWDMLSQKDFVICNRVLNYRSDTVVDDSYRAVFTDNKLPNVYSAFMYFKKTTSTFEIFDMVKYTFFNWEIMFETVIKPMHRPQFPSTDVIFALVLKLLDLDQHSYTASQLPTFTHMKSRLQGWGHDGIDEDWTKHMSVFFNPELECKIGNYLQFFPLHYHVKDFLTDEMIGYYERAAGR